MHSDSPQGPPRTGLGAMGHWLVHTFAFEHFQPIDLALGLAVASWLANRAAHCADIVTQLNGKLVHRMDSAANRIVDPVVDRVGVAAAQQGVITSAPVARRHLRVAQRHRDRCVAVDLEHVLSARRRHHCSHRCGRISGAGIGRPRRRRSCAHHKGCVQIPRARATSARNRA